LIKSIWNSPTITTWLSYATKTLTLFAVLPLILKNFSEGDVALWYLYFTILISVSGISEFGFKQTFSRLISFAFVGARDIGRIDSSNKQMVESEGPNIELMNSVVYGMRRIYTGLTLVFFIGLVTFGTWSLLKPMHNASNVKEGWVSWIVILVVSCIGFYGKIYVNYLEGLYKVALVKRIEILTSIAAIASSFLVLQFASSLLNLVLVNQFWVLVNIIRDWYLCYKIEGGLYKQVSEKVDVPKSIYSQMWAPAWRNGLGIAISTGIMNLNGVFVAQVADASSLASYLLALRLINQIKEISMAPFYSKLPLLAMLRVKNDIEGLREVCKRGMFMSNLSFALGFVLVGVCSNYLLSLIHSETQFVSHTMWLLLGIGFFFQRMGGMHIQVYMSSNHVISHITDIVSGVIFFLTVVILFRFIGIYAIPVGMITGYSGFYFWYGASRSYKSLGLRFGSFELKILPIPVLLIAAYIVYAYYGK
jgi:hypothetical protein